MCVRGSEEFAIDAARADDFVHAMIERAEPRPELSRTLASRVTTMRRNGKGRTRSGSRAPMRGVANDSPPHDAPPCYCPITSAKTSGATIDASDSMMKRGVSAPSLPHVIFSLGTAPEYEP